MQHSERLPPLGSSPPIPGAVAGGFLLGLVEVFSVAYVSSAFRDAIGFGLIFLILLVKPTGLAALFRRETSGEGCVVGYARS